MLRILMNLGYFLIPNTVFELELISTHCRISWKGMSLDIIDTGKVGFEKAFSSLLREANEF